MIAIVFLDQALLSKLFIETYRNKIHTDLNQISISKIHNPMCITFLIRVLLHLYIKNMGRWDRLKDYIANNDNKLL
jgi:hypothetical protein